MKIADCHMHSFFSSDSEAPTEEMVKRAVELGLPAICLTDHYDMDYSTGEFQLDTPAYAAKIRELQEKYRDKIDIRFGVELGLQLHLKERMEEYVNAWPFDYVIGSMHVIDGKDPYYEDAFPDWTAEELYRAYFRATAENIRFFHNFQTLGHLVLGNPCPVGIEVFLEEPVRCLAVPYQSMGTHFQTVVFCGL